MSIANEIPVGDAGSTPEQGSRDLRQTARDVKDAVVEKAGEVRDRATSMYESGREMAGKALETGKEKAQEYYHQGKAAAGEYLHEGVDRAKAFEHQVEGFIRQKPIQSVLIAVGVGVVLGALLKR